MHVEHLKKKGWSVAEVKHARKILNKAEKKRNILVESIVFWIIVCTLAGSVLALSVGTLPLIAFGSLGIIIPVTFLLGTCIGLLFVHVIRDSHLERTHHHLGAAALVIISFVSVAWFLDAAIKNLGIASWPFFISLSFVLGLCTPYVVHWRGSYESS